MLKTLESACGNMLLMLIVHILKSKGGIPSRRVFRISCVKTLKVEDHVHWIKKKKYVFNENPQTGNERVGIYLFIYIYISIYLSMILSDTAKEEEKNKLKIYSNQSWLCWDAAVNANLRWKKI